MRRNGIRCDEKDLDSQKHISESRLVGYMVCVRVNDEDDDDDDNDNVYVCKCFSKRLSKMGME